MAAAVIIARPRFSLTQAKIVKTAMNSIMLPNPIGKSNRKVMKNLNLKSTPIFSLLRMCFTSLYCLDLQKTVV